MIAALFVETNGCYYGIPGVDPWDKDRDARFYRGPWPIIAHPPCERWGKYWHGSPRKPHQYELGDDDGCFEAALRSLVLCGGVLDTPLIPKHGTGLICRSQIIAVDGALPTALRSRMSSKPTTGICRASQLGCSPMNL